MTYRLSSNETTKKEYPFDFELEITHRLQGGRLSVEWKVTNTGDKEMYFTIGGHPAFNVNVLPDTDFEDYSLAFKEGTESPVSYTHLASERGWKYPDCKLHLRWA